MPSSTPAIVAQNAVTQDALPLQQTTLIGLMTGPSGNTALIRTANGRIAKVAAGSQIGRQTIVAIDDVGLILQRNGTTERMAILPQ